MKYSKINLSTWARSDIFNHFINDVRCVVCITADIEVSKVLSFCKSGNYRFFPTFLFLITKALNLRDEFKIRYNESGDLILWDYISSSYVVLNSDDEIFTRLITEYSPDYDTFYNRVVSDMETNRDKRAFEIEYNVQNTFDASCLPWIKYSACDLHVFDSGTYLAPVVTWGQHERKDGRVLMPLTIQIHHAVADGFHIARFFSDIQNEIDILVKHKK